MWFLISLIDHHERHCVLVKTHGLAKWSLWCSAGMHFPFFLAKSMHILEEREALSNRGRRNSLECAFYCMCTTILNFFYRDGDHMFRCASEYINKYKHVFSCFVWSSAAKPTLSFRADWESLSPPLSLVFLSLWVEIKRPVVELHVPGLSSPASTMEVNYRTHFFCLGLQGNDPMVVSVPPRNQLWFSQRLRAFYTDICSRIARLV